MDVKTGLDLYNKAYAILIRLVPKIGYALQPASLDHLGHVLDHLGLVHLVGKLSEDYLGAPGSFLDLRLGLHQYAAPACHVGGLYPRPAHNVAARGKIRTGQVSHQVAQCRIWCVYEVDDCSGKLLKIVRRNVCGHAYSYARGTIEQQVGQFGRKNRGLLERSVIVGYEINGVLLDV